MNVFRILSKAYNKYGFAGINRGYTIRMINMNAMSLIIMPIFELVRSFYGIDITK